MDRNEYDILYLFQMFFLLFFFQIGKLIWKLWLLQRQNTNYYLEIMSIVTFVSYAYVNGIVKLQSHKAVNHVNLNILYCK